MAARTATIERPCRTSNMKQKNNPFSEWFEQQAGKPPSGDYFEVKEGAIHARWVLDQAEALFRAHQEYELKRQFALYAWCARDKK